MPRLARGNGYDLVIRHLAVGRVSFGGILEDSTYTFCQMSYDVGHDPSIVSQTEAFQASRNFIPYARYKTSFERRKSGLHTTPVPREKLYANPSYRRMWPGEKRPEPAPLGCDRGAGGRDPSGLGADRFAVGQPPRGAARGSRGGPHLAARPVGREPRPRHGRRGPTCAPSQ